MKRFNNIIARQEDYDNLNYYLQNNRTPESIRYKSRFIKKYEGFQKRADGTIIYAPLNLEVIPPNDKQTKLKEIYESDNSLGKGVYALFKYIQSKYIGITRNDVQEFVEFQSNYQLTQPLLAHRTNKPVISKYPNQLWALDLIDMQPFMSSNYGNRYIMNVVDIFSRKMWLAKLKNKGAVDTAQAFEEICERAGITPNYLLSDNGTEWKGEFATFCDENEITQRFTRSYSPQANGVVERANREIRKIIKAIMLQSNRFIWYNKLGAVETNRNDAYHSAIKGVPNQVWVMNKTKLTLRDLPESTVSENPRLRARVAIAKKALKAIRKFKEEDNYKVGDEVRLKMSSIFANVRKLVKDKDDKNLVVTYTPDVFYVSKVIVPRGILERKRYIVNNYEDKPITTAKKNIAQFYGSELLLWDGDENDAPITMEEALKLNKVEPNGNDYIY